RGNRLLPRTDALEPVAVMIAAHRKVDVVGPDLGSDDFRIARCERLGIFQLGDGIARGDGLVAPRNEDPAFAADETDAVWKIAADDHFDAVGVERLGPERAVDVPQAVRWKLRRPPDLNGPGVFGAHAPVRAVDVMGPPPGDHAGAELLAAQPPGTVVSGLRMDTLFRVGHDRRRPEPHLLIEIARHRHLGFLVAGRVAGQSDLHGLELADAAVPHELGGVAELG